jgi:predicted DNA-binding transcriptional regulator AlpA
MGEDGALSSSAPLIASRHAPGCSTDAHADLIGSLQASLDCLVSDLALDALPALIGTLEVAKTKALGRLFGQDTTRDRDERPPDVNLPAEEAARRLGVSKDWLYKNVKRLPFAIRIGRRLLFSSKGLERWNRKRQGC